MDQLTEMPDDGPLPVDRALTIAEWCAKHHVSQTCYRNLQKSGLGPRTYRVGGAVRISREADRDWMQEQENPSPARKLAMQKEAERRSRINTINAKASLKSARHGSKRPTSKKRN